MREFRVWLALAVLAAFVTACGDGVVDPSTPGSSALALSVTPTAEGDYSIDLKNVSSGLRRQDDKFVAFSSGGVSADGNWRARILYSDQTVLDSRGEITCLKLIDDGGIRLGGVVTHSSDPTLIGATMVATMKDGGTDLSTGHRVYTSGFDAQFHCDSGYANGQLTLNGVATFQAIKRGFIFVD